MRAVGGALLRAFFIFARTADVMLHSFMLCLTASSDMTSSLPPGIASAERPGSAHQRE